MDWNPNRHGIGGVVPEIHVHQLEETASGSSGAAQQQHCQGDLGPDQGEVRATGPTAGSGPPPASNELAGFWT